MDIIIPTTIGQGGVTRSSIASYYNSAGILTYAPNDTIRVNYDPTNLTALPSVLLESAATNTILSSEDYFLLGFTGIFVGSSIKLRKFLAPDNTLYADKLTEDTSTGVHSVNLNSQTLLDPAQQHVYSVYAKSSGRTQLRIRNGASSGDAWTFDFGAGTATAVGTVTNTATITNEGNGWYRCTVTFPSGATGQGVLLSLSSSGSNSYTGDGMMGVRIFGHQFENGTVATSYIPTNKTFVSRAGSVATYINSVGVITTAGTNVARMNYSITDLTIAPKLLVENASTNLLLQSSSFSTTPWNAAAATVTSNTTLAPDGTTTADTIADSSATVLQDVLQNSSGLANDSGTYVYSVFIKKTSGATSFPGIQLGLIGGTSVINAGVTLNTDTGIMTTTSFLANTPTYQNVVDYGTYWRFVIGCTNNSTGNTALVAYIYPAVNTDGSATWNVATTGSCITWGAQVEKQGYESSYIPTTTATVTRSADIFSPDNGTTRAADVLTYGLLYTNIPENDYPVWSSATTYAIGANVIYQHNIYNSLRASNLNFNPATDTSAPPYWLKTGPTNAYAMFDGQVGTLTTNNSGDIFVELNVGATTAVSFNEVSADSVTVQLYQGNTLMYNTVVDVTGGTTGIPVTDLTLTDLPSITDGLMKVTIHAASGIVSCGNFVAGTVYYLGSTNTDPTIGITDYSIKTIDAFGNPTLTKRAYTKRMNAKVLITDASQIDLVYRILAQNRSTPCVWNGNTTVNNRTSNTYSCFIVYGYYNDFEIDVDLPSNSYITLQIEGLI